MEKTDRWEYKVERIISSNNFSITNSDDFIEKLNTHGFNGWEVASILPLETGTKTRYGFEVFFKRKTRVPSLNPLCL